jgi:hypothetical protein
MKSSKGNNKYSKVKYPPDPSKRAKAEKAEPEDQSGQAQNLGSVGRLPNHSGPCAPGKANPRRPKRGRFPRSGPPDNRRYGGAAPGEPGID